MSSNIFSVIFIIALFFLLFGLGIAFVHEETRLLKYIGDLLDKICYLEAEMNKIKIELEGNAKTQEK